jgi:hypothetical protein
VSFSNILNSEETLTTENIDLAKGFFGISLVGKSHDGGWPEFRKINCTSCNNEYIAYIGVKETSNSVYGITFQGVAQIET